MGKRFKNIPIKEKEQMSNKSMNHVQHHYQLGKCQINHNVTVHSLQWLKLTRLVVPNIGNDVKSLGLSYKVVT